MILQCRTQKLSSEEEVLGEWNEVFDVASWISNDCLRRKDHASARTQHRYWKSFIFSLVADTKSEHRAQPVVRSSKSAAMSTVLLSEATEEERTSLIQGNGAADVAMSAILDARERGVPIPPPEHLDLIAAGNLDRDSEAWGFYILISYKPWFSLHHGDQPLMPDVGVSALQQCIKDQLICAKCHAPGSRRHSLNLKRCVRCTKVAYCNRKCQKAHWRSHKNECNGQES